MTLLECGVMVTQRSLDNVKLITINYLTMVNKIDLLTDDEFTETVNDSSCISDVLRKLGYSTNGNSWGT